MVASSSHSYIHNPVNIIERVFRRSTPYSWLFLLAVAGLTLAVRIFAGARTIDDAYITFRYARNILAGNGFVFNPGEHVLGTTTPLYTLLLTGLGLFTGGIQAPFPQLALWINALADAGTAILLFFLGRRFSSPIAGIAAAILWAVAPFSVTFAIGGLETSLYVLLLVSAASAYSWQHYRLAFFLGALAILTRPDALIFIGPLIADRCWVALRPNFHKYILLLKSQGTSAKSITATISLPVTKIRLIPEILAFCLPLLPWLLFATLYFGSPIPHSIAAKSLAYRLPESAGLVRLIQHYATPFHDNITFGTTGILIGLVLYPFLYILGARQAFAVDQRSWPFSLYPWAYFAVFAIANPLIFRWYLTPPLPAYFLFILMGLEKLLVSLKQQLFSIRPGVQKRFLTRRLADLLLVGWIVGLPTTLVLQEWQLHPDHGPDRPAPGMAWFQLELLYRQAAQFLEPQLTEDSVLAAGDVGVLGFYTPARILDTVGLNSPVSLRYYPLDPATYAINYAIPPNLIIDQQPDYIVILEVYGRLGLLRDPRFQAVYRLTKQITTDIYGSNGLLIFARIR